MSARHHNYRVSCAVTHYVIDISAAPLAPKVNSHFTHVMRAPFRPELTQQLYPRPSTFNDKPIRQSRTVVRGLCDRDVPRRTALLIRADLTRRHPSSASGNRIPTGLTILDHYGKLETAAIKTDGFEGKTGVVKNDRSRFALG